MIGRVEVVDFIAQLDAHGSALADAAERAGLDAAVPTCPEWDVRALLGHVGTVHRWAGGIVRGEPGAREQDDFPAPEDGVISWFREGHAALVSSLRSAPADLDVWAFLPAPSPLTFWARRQAHETAIHRADAEAAAGSIPRYDAEFAIDGIAELLEGFYARPRGRLVADPGFSLRVAPTDSDASWTVRVDPDKRTTVRHDEPATEQADCTLTAPASELYLDLWNRGGSTTAIGDPRVMQTWRDLATVRWS